MGTNFYVKTPPCGNACDHCAESEYIHLGKSSGGWQFSFQAQDGWGLDNAFTEWTKLAASGVITDEYDRPHTLEDLLELIHAKASDQSHIGLPDGGIAEWFTSDGYEFCSRRFS